MANEESRCKGCGKPIVWAKTANRKAMPLDPSAPVYRVRATPAGNMAERLNDGSYMVSHFCTCSHANDFSGKSRKGASQE